MADVSQELFEANGVIDDLREVNRRQEALIEEWRRQNLMLIQRLSTCELTLRQIDKLLSAGSYNSQALQVARDALAHVPLHRRVRHKKRGSEYDVIGEAEMQIATPKGALKNGRPIFEGDKLTVYRAHDGTLWARFPDEFEDGRFEDVK